MSISGGGKVQGGNTYVETSSPVGDVVNDVDVGEVTGRVQAEATEETPKDKYVTGERVNLDGPDTSGESDEEYTALRAAFVEAGIPDPYNPNTTPDIERRAASDPAFVDAVNMVKSEPNFDDPTVVRDFVDKLGTIKLCGNIMETLLVVMKDSMRESNEDKRYYLQRMRLFNVIGEALSQEMHKLSMVMSTLRARGKDEDNEPTVDVGEIRMFSPKEIGPDGMPVSNAESYTGQKTQFQLSAISKDLETRQEDLRNNRQMAQTAFQTADQRTNQLMNIMSTVLKTMNEMRGTTNRGLG